MPPRANRVAALPWFILSLFLLSLDQLTKLLVIQLIPMGGVIVLTDFLNLVHVHNSGAAFSFLADASQPKIGAISVATVEAIASPPSLASNAIRVRRDRTSSTLCAPSWVAA